MSVEAQVRNPFMFMVNPESVISAMEASKCLKELNRHECRPLDHRAAGPLPDGTSDGQREAVND